MQPKEKVSVVERRGQSLLATHTVLRNTYMLLSITLLFSALMAYIAMATATPALSPLITIVAYIGLLFLTSAFRNSGFGIVCVFLFTGFMGWTLGPMLHFYMAAYANGQQIIMTALGATGVIFLSLSAYVLTTKKDFSFLGGFLFVGLIVAILASLAAIFMPQIAGLQIALSAVMVLIFSGFILFDTSRIIHNGEQNYIMATIALYLDIYMLFVHLLNLLSALGGNRN